MVSKAWSYFLLQNSRLLFIMLGDLDDGSLSTCLSIRTFYPQSVMEFLKDLPSYDEHNFTLFNTDHGIRNCSKRPSIYLQTKEIPSEQS